MFIYHRSANRIFGLFLVAILSLQVLMPAAVIPVTAQEGNPTVVESAPETHQGSTDTTVTAPTETNEESTDTTDNDVTDENISSSPIPNGNGLENEISGADLPSWGQSDKPLNFVEIPNMNFKPPQDADDLDDFIPPGLSKIEATKVESDQLASIDLPVGGGVATFNGGLVAVVVEDGTFSVPTQLKFSFQSTPTLTSSTVAELSSPEGITMTSDITLTLGMTPTLGITPTAEITATSAITLVTNDTPTLENKIQLDPDDGAIFARFHMEAIDSEKGENRSEFDKPVRIVIDVRRLAAGLDLTGFHWVLSYRDEDGSDTWYGVDPEIHQENGLISAEVSHFSEWYIGVRPNSWTPVWTQPVVSQFSGSITYQYPIQIPPGRNGMQPNVALSYDSRGVDGHINDSFDQGPIALGWSLPQISIIRSGVKIKREDDDLHLVHPDRFRMVLNGKGYELFTADQSTEAIVRYYAKGDPSIRIYRYYNSIDVPNLKGLFWVITTPDGTQYRLGYTPDSEQWQMVNKIGRALFYGHLGRTEGDLNKYSVLAWHVDTVTDVYGNQMVYSYNNLPDEKIYGDGDNSGDLIVTTNKCRIYRIDYNFTGLAASIPADPYIDQPIENPQSRIEFRADSSTPSTDYIKSIYIYHNNLSVPIFEYRINSIDHDNPSDKCKTRNDNIRYTHVRVVQSIQQFTNSVEHPLDNNPLVDESGYALPAVTFGYDVYRHFTKGDIPNENNSCFNYSYISEINNGYGGVTNISYQADGHQVGDYEVVWYYYTEFPRVGYSYYVTDITTEDGMGNSATTDYEYSTPCYDQTSTDPDDLEGLPGAFACPNADSSEYGSLCGFHQTTETVKGYDDEVIQESITQFHQDTDKMGRVNWTEVYDGNGVKLQYTLNNWGRNSATCEIGSVPSGAGFTCLGSTVITNYEPEDRGSRKKTIGYRYEVAGQGGNQYGQLTRVTEYDNADVVQRIKKYKYKVNSSDWVIVPHIEAVFQGDWTLESALFHLYDGETDLDDQQITIGERWLTRQRLIVDHVSCPTDEETIDTTFSYDDYGNLINSFTYPEYGHISCNSSTSNWNDGGLPGGGSQPYTTTIIYDEMGLLPIASINTLNQDVSVSYNTKFPWLPDTITDTNDFVTNYTYDVFGRLEEIWELNSPPGSTPTFVLKDKYEYYDTEFPLYIDHVTLPGSNSLYELTGRTFYDGLGRPIQQRTFNLDVAEDTNVAWQHTEYDALGRVVCQTNPQPGAQNAYSYYDKNCADWTHTTNLYNIFGNAVKTTSPDGSETNAFSYPNTTIVVDANKHIRSSTTDDLGRLVEVDETMETFTDEFDDLDAHWTFSGHQTIENGVIKNTGTGTDYNARFYTPDYPLSSGEGVYVEFKVDNPTAYTHFMLESGTGDEYRRWCIIAGEDMIYAQANLGNSQWRYPNNLIVPLEENVWYVMVMEIREDDLFTVDVWKKDDPTIGGHSQYTIPGGTGWRFNHRINIGNAYLDNYVEFNYQTTQYGYNILDNLVVVTDTLGTTTHMVYDALGRKTSMQDPDMGNWSYEYDPAGNLITQTDAIGNILSFQYDALNRLTVKNQNGQPAAQYYYDEPEYGYSRGSRTRMVDGTGSSSWYYDYKGRVITSTKTINGVGENSTGYTYNSLDQVASIKYPNGEVVETTFNQQGMPESLIGDDAYTFDVDYTVAGQLETLLLGNDRTTQYEYDPFTLRVRQIETSSLLDLSYYYDRVGNVLAIHDGVRNETSQYEYDSLDRLTEYDMANSGEVQITVRAKGVYKDSWPVMQLYVNGIQEGEWTVDSTDWDNYSAQAPLLGDDEISVIFLNPSGFTAPEISDVGCYDAATGSGYIMYSEQDVHQRFAANQPNGDSADHFICVKYDSGWKYDTNTAYFSFTPLPTDILVASVNYTNDTVADLKGQAGVVYGITKGYRSGDLEFKANTWEGEYAYGEFGLTGTGFVPYVSPEGTAPINYGIACIDTATGSGYIMYSEASVHTRFSAHPPHSNNADLFICVKYSGGVWYYDNNSAYYTFTPVSTDLLVASVDFSADTVSLYNGVGGVINGIKYGYLAGNINFQPNMYNGSSNSGEFGITGDGFARNEDVPNGRIMYVDYINVNGQVEQAEGSNSVFDRGEEEAAFDWIDVKSGQQDLSTPGALHIALNNNVGWTNSEAYTYDVVGNMTSRTTGFVVNYSYNDSAHVHAVTELSNGNKYLYDENGNMIIRYEEDAAYRQTFDAENRLISVTSTSEWSSFATTLQPAGPGIDSYVNEKYASYNYGSETLMKVHPYAMIPYDPKKDPYQKHALIKFELSDIQPVADISNATLTLNCAKGDASVFYYPPIELYRADESWQEGKVNWNNQPGITGSTIGTINLGSTTLTEYSFNVTSLVQSWVDGSLPNDGIKLISSDIVSVITPAYCASSDYGTASKRPKLVIQGQQWDFSQSETHQFLYDGDGNRVKTIYPDNSWTAYVGDHYEVESDGTERSYYFLGSQRIAMRIIHGGDNYYYFLHTDHLNSTSLLSDERGDWVPDTEARYLPYGEYRVEPTADLTDVGYTGHRMYAYIKLVDMKARWYDPQIGRFIQPDTIVPDITNPQSFNRYSYVKNRPLVCNDPSGHCPWCPIVVLVGLTILLTSDSPQSERILTDYSNKYLEVAQDRNIDPVVLAAVVRHESGAVERVAGDFGERILMNMGDPSYSSIGIGQMQPRIAEELEQAGYITAQPDFESRVNALFNPNTAIDYVGARLQYLGDQIDNWSSSKNISLNQDTRNRLTILAYNLGWKDSATQYDLLDLLEESTNVDALIDQLTQYGYVNEQVFTDGVIINIESILGVEYGE